MRTVPANWIPYLDAEIVNLMNTEPDSVVGALCWERVDATEEYLTKVDNPDHMRPFAARHAAHQCAVAFYG